MALRRYRTQEVAGSSPASSTSPIEIRPLRGHDDLDRLRFSIQAVAADAG